MKNQSRIIVLKYLSQIVVERSDEGMRHVDIPDEPAYIQFRVPESFLTEFSALNWFEGMLMPGFMFWKESGLVDILGAHMENLSQGKPYLIDALEYLNGDVEVDYQIIPESKEVRISVRESD